MPLRTVTNKLGHLCMVAMYSRGFRQIYIHVRWILGLRGHSRTREKKKRRRKGRFLEKRGLKREEHIGDMVQGQRPASSYSVCARLSLFFSKKSRPVCYTRTHIQLRMLGDFWISVGRHRKCTLHASD